MINKKILSLTLIGLLSTTTIANAEWKKNNIGWWNSKGSSWSVGWEYINNQWYYFDANGYMKTGWVNSNGKWYYLSNDGHMLSNIVTPDGYTLNADGSWNINIPKKQTTQSTNANTSNNQNNNTNISKNENKVENNSNNTSSITKKKKHSSSSSSNSSSSSKNITEKPNNPFGVDNSYYDYARNNCIAVFYYEADLRIKSIGVASIYFCKENYKEGINAILLDYREYGYDDKDKFQKALEHYELYKDSNGKVNAIEKNTEINDNDNKNTNEEIKTDVTTDSQVEIN